MSSDTSLPVDLEDRLRAYFGAFLPEVAADEAVNEVAADLHYWHDVDEVSAFRTAHLLLTGQVRVATDVEALVLHHDADLPVPAVGRVLGLPEAEVRRRLHAALIELGEAPATSPSPHEPGPRREPGPNTIRIDALEEADELDEVPEPTTTAEGPTWSPRRRWVVALLGVLLIGAVVTGVVLAVGGTTG